MKKFLALFLTTLLLLAPMTIFAVGATSNKDVNEEKITDELKEVMADKKNNEYIPIYIWLYDLGDNVIYNRLSSQKNKNITSDSETEYLNNRIEEKIKEYEKQWLDSDSEKALLKFEKMTNKAKSHSLRNEAKISNKMTEEELDRCIKEGKTYEEIIELSERTQYLSEFRENRSTVNLSLNGYFESLLKTNKVKNIYSDKLLPYVQLECKKSYIAELSAFSMIEKIGYNRPLIVSQVNPNEETNYVEDLTNKYVMAPQETYGKTGVGIKIGVIEANAQMFDNKATHLHGRTNIIDSFSNTETGLTHVVKVLSILCGRSFVSEGQTYVGIAPNASIYVTQFKTTYEDDLTGWVVNTDQLYNGLYWLIVENGVHVINMSAYTLTDTNYSTFDKYYDCLVSQYRVAIVKSAGNNGAVTSPGLAYNVITVGNASNQKNDNNKYIMDYGSGYVQAEGLSNKPDLVAFGSNICMLYNEVETNFGIGTSYAAPMVSGTIALMMEENQSLIGKPDAIKALLLASANEDAISCVDNADPYYYANPSYFSNANSNLKTISGAGLLNIQNAIKMANSNILYRYEIPVGSTWSNLHLVTSEYYFQAGETIELTLVFENSQHQLFDYESDEQVAFQTNFNIRVLNAAGMDVMYSYNPFNNVESFSCTFALSGYYRFEIEPSSVATQDHDEVYNILDDIKDSNRNMIFDHQVHDSSYLSFIISCDCSLSCIEQEACTREGHNMVCANCNFSCFEKHEEALLTNNSTYSTVTYDVKYLFKTPITGVAPKECECYYPLDINVQPKNNTHIASAIIETYDSEYQSNGNVLETYTFWIMVRDSTGTTISSTYQTVKVYYDAYVGEYYIVNA